MLTHPLPSRSNTYWALIIGVLWTGFVCALPEVHMPVQKAILGTLAAVGGGLAAGGILGGFLSRPDKNADIGPLLDRVDELTGPNPEQFARFRRLAAAAGPGLDEFMMVQEAQGGGQRMAELAAARQARRAGDQALNQFGQFRASQSQQANRLLAQASQMQQRQQLARSRSTMSLFNNIASLGGQVAGTSLGQLGAMRMQQPRSPSGTTGTFNPPRFFLEQPRPPSDTTGTFSPPAFYRG